MSCNLKGECFFCCTPLSQHPAALAVLDIAVLALQRVDRRAFPAWTGKPEQNDGAADQTRQSEFDLPPHLGLTRRRLPAPHWELVDTSRKTEFHN